MSDDQLTVSRELVRLAVAIALEAPYSKSKNASSATVRWDTIKALRVELEKHGVNWRAHHRRNRPK
jgi:hypothetical protein